MSMLFSIVPVTSPTVRSAGLALAAAAGLAVATTASGQTAVFSNDCGTGTWGGLCAQGGGVYSSNWGRTGPSSPALLPGPADTCLLAGVVTLNVGATIAQLDIPTGATLVWPSNTLSAAALNNSGTVSNTTGSNKFLTGTAANSAGAQWGIDAGSLYLTSASLTNAGTLTFSNNGSLRRSGGTVSDTVFYNNATVLVTSQGNGSTLADITVVGSPASVWITDSDAALAFSGVAFSGTITGDHDGTASLEGNNTLAADTTFATTAGSNPWRWTNATFSTGGFTLTNAGLLLLDTGLNKFLSGAAVNTPTGTWTVGQGSFYLSPGSGTASLTNNGTLDIGLNASIRRTGGATDTATLSNNGTVRATQAGAALADITLQSSGGTWATTAGSSLALSAVRLSGSFVGNHAGSSTMDGGVTLAAETSFSSAPGSPNPWGWSGASMNTGVFTFTNHGRIEANTGLNKFLTGTAVNAPGASWALAQGTFYLSPGAGLTSLTNSGTLSIAAGASLARNGGAVANARLVNNGLIESLGANTSVSNIARVSNGGVWRTAPGATLNLNDGSLSGQFIGDHSGDGTLSGSMLLTGDATFASTAGSTNPWRWTSASIDANGFTLTNTGRMEFLTGFNRFLTGSAVNAPGAEFIGTQGTFYLAPGGNTGTATLTNNGTITLNNGASIARNGGAVATAVLNNNGLLLVTGAGSSISNLSLNNGAAGVIRIDGGGTLSLPSNWSMAAGRLEGTGQFTSTGTTGFTNEGGTVAPGSNGAAGTLNSGHRYTQGAGGTLEIAVVSDGLTQTVSQLNLTATGFNAEATLGGTLRVVLPGGTSPPPIGGLSYTIVNAPGGRSGAFDSIVAADPIPNYRYTVSYTPTQAILRVVRRCGGADLASQGADANFDGVLDNNDFVVYIDLFFNQDPLADVGSTGGVLGSDGNFDNNDFVVYIDLFFSGCQ